MPVAFECVLCKIQRVDPWIGKCPNCGRRCNIKRVMSNIKGAKKAGSFNDLVGSLADVDSEEEEFIPTGHAAVDRVLSGGFAKDCITMLHGSPGSGKSTLLTAICIAIARQGIDVLYLSLEESLKRMRNRAARIGKIPRRFNVGRTKNLDDIIDTLDELKPGLFVIDSVQAVAVDGYRTGSASAICEVGEEVQEYVRNSEKAPAAILVVQESKDGQFAGPNSLEHLVDTSIEMVVRGEGEEAPRVLRCPRKNRLGVSGRVAYFKMTDKGLVEAKPEIVPVNGSPACG